MNHSKMNRCHSAFQHSFLLLLILLFCSLVQQVYASNEKPEEKTSVQKLDTVIPDTKFSRFLPTLGYNFTKGLFSTHSLGPLYFGSFGAAMAYPFDKGVSEQISPYTAIGDAGQVLGSPLVAGITAGSMIVAPFTHNSRFRAFAFDMGQAYIMSYTIVQVTKVAVGRTRPNQESDNSFPSGHASDSFVLARVIDHYYGKKLGIPAYALACFVSFARIERGKHYPSDVIFGGSLGYLFGDTAIRVHAQQQQKKLTFLPYAGPHNAGIQMSILLK